MHGHCYQQHDSLLEVSRHHGMVVVAHMGRMPPTTTCVPCMDNAAWAQVMVVVVVAVVA